MPAGGVTVSGPATGPFRVEFTGPLARASMPTLTSSDPAIAVTHDGTAGSSVGGLYPSISINGGAAIPMKYPVWGAGLPDSSGNRTVGPYSTMIQYLLIQSAPNSAYYPARVGYSNFSFAGGSPNNPIAPAGSYHVPLTQAWPITAGGVTANWSLQALPAGTYRLTSIHAAAPGNTTAALYTATDGNGNALGTATVDQTAAPSYSADGSTHWAGPITFTLTSLVNTVNVRLSNAGAAGSTLIADCLRLERTSADLSVKIAPTDTVTFSATSGFAATTAGPLLGMINAPVTNPGTIIPPHSSKPGPLKLGYNIEGENYYGTGPKYTNFAKRLGGAEASPAVLAFDADGYPTKLSQPYTIFPLIDGTYSDQGGAGRGCNNAPSGPYTIMWDGASVVDFGYSGPVSASTTGATNNVAVYNVGDPYTFAPSVRLRIQATGRNSDGTYACDVRNLRVYPPDPATGKPWVNPPKWYPSLLAQLGGARNIRTMDAMNTNDSNNAEYSDLTPASRMGYGSYPRIVSVPIAQVRNYAGTRPYFTGVNRMVIEFVTAVPHGFVDGMTIQVGDCGTATFAASSAPGATYPAGSVEVTGGYPICVTSPTTFAAALYAGAGSSTAIPMSNVLTPSGVYAQANIGGGGYAGGMAFTDTVDLANAAGTDLWINVPHLMSDDGVTKMAAYIAANLRADLNVHVEYSNECWNISFTQSLYCIGMSRSLLGAPGGYDPTPFQVYRSVQVHRLFRQAFTAAGKNPLRVRRFFGLAPNGTAALLNFLTGNIKAGTGLSSNPLFDALGPIAFDECGPAPYYSNSYIAEPTLKPLYDLMTIGQSLDYFEMFKAMGGDYHYIRTYSDPIAAAKLPYPLDLVFYECGLTDPVPEGSVQSANYAARAAAMARHPRMYGIHLNTIQQWQEGGAKLANVFYVNGGNPLLGTYIGQWNTYMGWSMVAGTGDPEKDAMNVSDPTNLPMVKSEPGGAMNFAAMLAAVWTWQRNTPRHSQMKATGLRRGMARRAR